MERMKTVNYKTIERHAKKIEKENIKKFNTSLSWVSILNRVTILCIHHGSNYVDVYDNWKDELNELKYENESQII